MAAAENEIQQQTDNSLVSEVSQKLKLISNNVPPTSTPTLLSTHLQNTHTTHTTHIPHTLHTPTLGLPVVGVDPPVVHVHDEHSVIGKKIPLMTITLCVCGGRGRGGGIQMYVCVCIMVGCEYMYQVCEHVWCVCMCVCV